MLKNASFLAIVAVHTAENEPLKVWKKAEKWALCEAPELTALQENEAPRRMVVVGALSTLEKEPAPI